MIKNSLKNSPGNSTEHTAIAYMGEKKPEQE